MAIETPEIKKQERRGFAILLTIAAVALVGAVMNAQAVVTPEDNSDSRVCFGTDAHARCFELRGSEFAQTVRGGVIQHQVLDTSEQLNVKKAITEYKTWTKTRHTEKEAKARKLALIKTLEKPKLLTNSAKPKK